VKKLIVTLGAVALFAVPAAVGSASNGSGGARLEASARREAHRDRARLRRVDTAFGRVRPGTRTKEPPPGGSFVVGNPAGADTGLRGVPGGAGRGPVATTLFGERDLCSASSPTELLGGSPPPPI
jgi:hypothetical protein